MTNISLILDTEGAAKALIELINSMKAAGLNVGAFEGDLVKMVCVSKGDEVTAVALPSPDILRRFADMIEHVGRPLPSPAE